MYRQRRPTHQVEHIQAAREKRLEGSAVADWSKTEFRDMVQDPPQWLIMDAKKNGDLLVRLMKESGWDNTERWAAAKRWVKGHGAGVLSPTQGIKKKAGGSYSSSNKKADWIPFSHQGLTPLGVAISKDEPQAISCWLSGAWSQQLHGVAMKMALESQAEKVLNELWKMDPPLHRLDIGLELALWSDTWVNNLLDKGVVLTRELTRESLKKILPGSSNRTEAGGVVNRLKTIERTSVAQRRVRGQAKPVKINWEEVVLWCREAGQEQKMVEDLALEKRVNPCVVLLSLLEKHDCNPIQAVKKLGKHIKHNQYLDLLYGTHAQKNGGVLNYLVHHPQTNLAMMQEVLSIGVSGTTMQKALEDICAQDPGRYGQAEQQRKQQAVAPLLGWLQRNILLEAVADIPKNEPVKIRRKM